MLNSQKIFANARNQLIKDMKKDFNMIKICINRIEMVAFNYFLTEVFNVHKNDVDDKTVEKMTNEAKLIILRCIEIDNNLT